MGLPQLDFRVPEATWLKSALGGRFGLASRFGSVPGLSSTGALAWPYKIAVVAVMALVACGTLVTFGSAGAETPTQAEVAALPGTDEASPSVEGQVLPPPSQALLNSQDLMSSLNLMDYSPDNATTFSLTGDDDDEDSDDNGDDDTESDTKKKSNSSTPKPSSSPSSDGDGSSESPSDDETDDPDPVEGPKHKQWREDMAAYEDDHDEWEEREEAYDKCMGGDSKLVNLKAFCKSKEPGDEPDEPDEPSFTS